MIQETAEYVIEHISLSVDAEEVFDAIQEVKNALDELERRYK